MKVDRKVLDDWKQRQLMELLDVLFSGFLLAREQEQESAQRTAEDQALSRFRTGLIVIDDVIAEASKCL